MTLWPCDAFADQLNVMFFLEPCVERREDVKLLDGDMRGSLGHLRLVGKLSGLDVPKQKHATFEKYDTSRLIKSWRCSVI